MPQASPRIPPVAPEAFTPEQKALVGDWSAMNFARVIVEHPSLYRALMPLIAKLIATSDLPPKDREILVLRTLELCDETYEAAHHGLIARGAGMTAADIEAARRGAETLSPFEALLARAAEELVAERRVRDDTWAALAERYSSVQLMELVAVVGLYQLMAMLTKSFEIGLETPEVFNRFAEQRSYT